MVTENIFDLTKFGPLTTAAQADSALEKAAAKALAAGGGIIVIPANAPAGWQPQNRFQHMIRTPPPPAPAQQGWDSGPGVTIVDARKPALYVPPATGLRVERSFNLQPGDSSPHWQYHPGVLMNSHVVGASANYRGRLLAPVAAGNDRRFVVPTLQGLQPGQSLQVHLPDGKAAPAITTKVLGFDRELAQSYFVADTTVALPIGSRLETTTAITSLRTTTNAHNELQTFDVMTQRHHYSQGDTYLYDGYLNYMGNESAASPQPGPDADGLISRGPTAIFNAVSRSMTNIFRGQVEAITPAGELRYTAAANAHTLATGRPIINLNPAKLVTEGQAFVTHPGGAMLNWGNSVRSRNAPWTAEMVGRYFAIDEPSEYVPASGTAPVRRWWQITGFQEKDGVKMLNLRRYWWGAKNAGTGISALYDEANWTTDNNNPRLLRYVIAPGTYVYDVADGVGLGAAQSSGGGTRTLRLSPYVHRGTALDFAPGDAIEQAIGPEPFHPIPFRAWFADRVPGVFPAPALDIGNMGHVTRHSAFQVGGSSRYGSVLRVQPDAHVGDALLIAGDADSLFLFRQKNGNSQTIGWNAAGGTRALGANPTTGVIGYNGGISFEGAAISGVTALSGQPGAAPGTNLRGIAVPVPAGAQSVNIAFPTAEADAQFAVTVQPNWLTNRAVTTQSAAGFTVLFSTPAPANARINWLIVR